MKTLDEFVFDSEVQKDISLHDIKSKLLRHPWKKGQYAKQNWRHSFHSIAPYVGKITPAFAHWLIKLFTKKGDLILDPFCGIGTIPLEADLLHRYSIGIDLNHYAYICAKAKFDRKPFKNRLEWINKVELNTQSVNLDKIDPYALQFYDENTLKEIIAIRDEMIKDNQYFLLSCLLAISHGHRPQHLSAVTGYIIPYPKKGSVPEYKNVKVKLIQKAKRMYKDPIHMNPKVEIIEGDIKKVDFRGRQVDCIISSPPYYETLDYIASNKLRLILLGKDLEEQKVLANDLIQHKESYLDDMKEVGNKLKDILKVNGLMVFVLGDVKRGKKMIKTAEDISKLYENLGFETQYIIEDKIPKEKAIIGKFSGLEPIKDKPEKSDRILVMKNVE